MRDKGRPVPLGRESRPKRPPGRLHENDTVWVVGHPIQSLKLSHAGPSPAAVAILGWVVGHPVLTLDQGHAGPSPAPRTLVSVAQSAEHSVEARDAHVRSVAEAREQLVVVEDTIHKLAMTCETSGCVHMKDAVIPVRGKGWARWRIGNPRRAVRTGVHPSG